MKILSVNTGLPRDVVWHGRTISTGIYKQPVQGRVAVRTLNLDGDRQADLTVHGGTAKAVYCYPAAHYDWWRRELRRRDLEYAAFGENLTLADADEDAVHLGDEFAIGSAHVIVTQPRMPCFKLGLRFGSDAMVKRFLASGRSGFYLAVTREGDVAPGDEMTLRARNAHAVPVSDITRLYVAKRFTGADAATIEKALDIAALPESWKDHFRDRLAGSR